MKQELDIFSRKKPDFARLLAYGFNKEDGNSAGDSVKCYKYTAILPSSGFVLHVWIDKESSGAVWTEVIDPASGEEYTLHLRKKNLGEFAAAIKQEQEEILEAIAGSCFEPDVFCFPQTKELIGQVEEKYGDSLEFLWKKFSDNAVWRRKDTGKWYGVIMRIPKSKLGFEEDTLVEILDLRHDPKTLPDLIDHEKYFPGWHMSKKSWYSIILDHSVDTAEILEKIQTSYKLAK